MRVAFDASPVRGRKTGIGVYTADLMRALNEYAPQMETVALDDGVEVSQRTDKRILREQRALPRLAANAHADLLHLTGFAAPLRSRVPVILTVMDLIGVLFSQNFPPASRFYWSRYLPYTLRSARHLITLSENTRQDILRLTRTPENRITVIPPGVDPRFQVVEDSALLEQTAARLQLPRSYLLFVSTLEPRKGIDTLLDAYAGIAPQVEQDLVIVGKRGWYYETLFDRVRARDLENRVRFTDYIADADMPVVYNLATAFVFPSRYEGFGLTPLEAMACGTPVISSNAASLPEVVGAAGILLAPTDTAGFAAAMRELCVNQELRAELRDKGLRRVRLFSWRRAVEQTVKVYAQVQDSNPTIP